MSFLNLSVAESTRQSMNCPRASTSSPRCTPATPPPTTPSASPCRSRPEIHGAGALLPGRSGRRTAQTQERSLAKTPLSELWRHPIHTREFGSQVTNVLRCLQLEAHGYQVTVTELVGWEHSMKNELIIARRQGAPRGNARERLDHNFWNLAACRKRTLRCRSNALAARRTWRGAATDAFLA
jgi:hypothetical protein